MKTQLIFLFIFLLSTSIGCKREGSSGVVQDNIFQSHRISYLGSQDETSATSTFRFNDASGLKLELDEDASILFENEDMSWKNTLAYYEQKEDGFINSGIFTYTDLDGSTFTNTISVNPIDFLTGQSSETISKSIPFELIWEGEVLQSGESVELTIDPEADGVASQYIVQNNEGSNSFNIGTTVLEALPLGVTALVLERTHTSSLSEGTTAGGELEAKYTSDIIQVEIVP